MAPSIESLTDAAIHLYGVEPTDFIAARTALVKQLRTDGNKELAIAVKELRKPSLIAAELNRAVRSSSSDLDQLLTTADELSEGHRAMLGGDSVDLGSLQSNHRAAAASVAAHAARDRDRIASLLEAASLDKTCHGLLRAGTFAVEPSPASGFDLLAGAPVVRRPSKVASLDRARRRRTRAAGDKKSEDKQTPKALREPKPQRRPKTQRKPKPAATSITKRTPKPNPEAVRRAEKAVALSKRRVDAAAKKRTRAVERVDELERRLADARTNLTETELAEAAAAKALATAEDRLAEVDGGSGRSDRT